MPREIHQEFTGDGPHVEWIKDPDVKSALILDEAAKPELVQQVIQGGYQGADPAFNDIELEKCGKDPVLIDYALADRRNRTVVTREKSGPSKRLGATKLPDACADLGIRCIDDFELYRELDFKIKREPDFRIKQAEIRPA